MLALYFFVLELMLYGMSFYLLYTKKGLVVIYIPLLLFMTSLIDEFMIRSFFRYALFTGLILYPLLHVRKYTYINIYSLLLVIYFSVLYLFNSPGLAETRPEYASMVWLFLLIFFTPNIFKSFSHEKIRREIKKMTALLLHLFIINTIVSTLLGYSPNPMYGFITGVLFGGMYAAAFNIIPLAIFGYFITTAKRISLYNVLVIITSYGLIMLTMRRSVMFVATVGVCIVILWLLIEARSKKGVWFFSFVTTFVVLYTFSGFADHFTERVEQRFEQRDHLVSLEEGRFVDHILVYHDLFTYERYSKWTGYEFFNSPGNYAGGIMGERSLHGDIPVIAHASGLIGVVLYLLMVYRAFGYSWKHKTNKEHVFLIIFLIIAFLVYSLTGRVTNTASVTLLYVLLFIPLSAKHIPGFPTEA